MHHRRPPSARHCAQLTVLTAGILSTLTAHAAIEAGGWEVNHWSDDNIQFSIYQLPNQQDVTYLYGQVSHDTAIDGTTFNRDSDGYRAALGMRFKQPQRRITGRSITSSPI